jgi:hypothetical protein
MKTLTLLVALAAASAALFILPAVGVAEEIHYDTATTFTGTGGAGSLTATNEPTITCESTDITNGVINAGGTTGTMTLDFTGCHAVLLGITATCKTTGAPVSNTVASGGSFHLITIKTGVPGVLVTANTTELECKDSFGNVNFTHVTGNIIGTITSPACNAESKEMKLSFSATGSTQNHLEYTGTKYDLIAKTGKGGTGEPRTYSLNASWTLTTNAVGKLTCT